MYSINIDINDIHRSDLNLMSIVIKEQIKETLRELSDIDNIINERRYSLNISNLNLLRNIIKKNMSNHYIRYRLVYIITKLRFQYTYEIKAKFEMIDDFKSMCFVDVREIVIKELYIKLIKGGNIIKDNDANFINRLYNLFKG